MIDSYDSRNIEDAPGLLELNRLGTKSALAQNLLSAITNAELIMKSNHVLLVYSDSSKCMKGYLKYGHKELYFFTKSGKVIKKPSCLCVLDFYVDEASQRHGIGLELFENLLKRLDCSPDAIAYDRPSTKLVAFLSKHYGLVSPDYQPNRFMVFPNFLC